MAIPNTIGIMQQIQSLLQATGVYTGTAGVQIGVQQDWSNAAPLAEIQLVADDSEHFAFGGKIEDVQGFLVRSVVDYTNQTPLQAVTQLCNIRDTVIPLFQQHVYLNGQAGVQDSRVKPGAVRAIIAKTTAGTYYLVHELVVEVRSMYNVPNGASGI